MCERWWRSEKGRRRREAERGSPVKKGTWYENEVLCLQPISTDLNRLPTDYNRFQLTMDFVTSVFYRLLVWFFFFWTNSFTLVSLAISTSFNGISLKDISDENRLGWFLGLSLFSYDQSHF